ncbi:bis-aminopropyl spermidine synthase family protein [Longispora sp. NPDC051575]|uniref:bis-aminopropyl spermidine synthase family protein n=1 Tax=Longispora sp. NPDC051575 TaxID=3154943 RepID=UPI003424E30B
MINGDLAGLLTEVAEAVGLQEGESGVERVLRAIRELEPASTKAVSRHVGLPLPVIAAINNELRTRGVVTKDRPSRLTDEGRTLLESLPIDLSVAATCQCCDGHSVEIPADFDPILVQLAKIMEGAPGVDLTLDQSFATVETKVRRVLLLMRYGLLPSRAALCVGDDDLMAVAIAAVGAAIDRPLVGRLAVVDISPEILEYTRACLAELGVAAELVEHDLREPLPEALRQGFDLALTDPPYTTEGAGLFLSRAVEALVPGPGRSVVFSFGPKGPSNTLQVQRVITELGLTVQAMHRNFNEYLGAGVIAGVSHLQYLSTTAETAPLITSAHAGPLYTADQRSASREYVCNKCATRYAVGKDAEWPTIAALKEATCRECGGDRFRPLQLIRDR